MFGKKIGVDLGTVNVLVYVSGRGIVLQEPSVVALVAGDNRIVALGREALEMLGRTPESIEVLRPMREGVIADYMVTEAMLRYFIAGVVGRFRLIKPEMMISIPVGSTSVESRAVHDAAIQAGARSAYLIKEPLAAALGAEMPVETATGNMVVNIGGGTTEAAVVSLNDIVVADDIRVGGIRMDEAIAAYVRRKYNLVIGDRTAEDIKIKIGRALPSENETRMEVRGRDQVAGLPRVVEVSSGEITEAISEPLAQIASAVRGVLEITPPELAADIIDRGIVLAGGGALLRDMDRFLTQETGIPCYLADEAMACVVLGAGMAIERLPTLKRVRAIT